MSVNFRFAMPLLLVVILGSGCAFTVRTRLPLSEEKAAELNDLTVGSTAKVMLARPAGATVDDVMDVKIGPTTTTWLERDPSTNDWLPRTVVTSDVCRVEVRSIALGAFEGFLVGLPLGTAIGAIVGASQPKHGEGLGALYFNDPATFLALVGGGVSGLLGAVIGGAIGDRTTIHFDAPRETSSADRPCPEPNRGR
jgi:hypothetical protein